MSAQEKLNNLRSDAELCSTFAAALFRTGHKEKARTWLDKAEAIWLEWTVRFVEAQQSDAA